jgi:hypothetical protein
MKVGRLALGIVVFGILSTLAIKGCEYFPESSFQLADDSRLPRWITVPPGLTRADVSVTMNYLTMPLFFDDTQIIVKDRTGKTLAKVSGRAKDLHHGKWPDYYPAYVVITVKGVTDIVEHRRMEPVFYVTDDPAIWKDLPGE